MFFVNKILLSFFVITFLLVSCDTDIFKKKPKQDYPGEYMYNQRAFPENYINKSAIAEAIIQTRTAKNQKLPNTGSWTLEGPINIGGRITDIAISPIDENVFYIGTAVGGIFKTVDKGQNWTPIFDNIGRPSIGNIAIAPSNANRIYIGTGEANGSATSGAFFGDGIYRSDDAGATWTHLGLEGTQYTGRIIVDPQNENRLFVATSGTLYGKNTERGLYRSSDAGNTWEQVLYISDSTAVIDVVMHPTNTDTLYAATWERIRYPWIRDYGGVTSGVYRTYDGGDTWEPLTFGLPVSNEDTGRIGLAISKSDPNIVFASYTTNSITNEFQGLYRSTNNGDNWTEITGGAINDVNASFGWYFGNVRVDPENPDEIYVLGQQLYKTYNGGTSWLSDSYMHVDHHAMEYAPTNPDMILSGNDGGLYISENAGNTWTHFENLPISQFYNIEVDHLQPQRHFGGAQDNNTLRTTTGSNDDWHAILGGDGFQVNVDPNNSNYVYAESQWGNLFRSTDGGNTMSWAIDGISSNDRTNWNTPIEISPYDTNVLFYGSNKLYRSTNNAQYWNPISDDLTDGEHPSGSLAYGTLTCIAPSYNNLDVIYTGSDDGNVSVTFDGGNTWQSIDDDLPKRFVSQVAIHPNDDLTAYVTMSGYHMLDYAPHVFKTTNGGQTWIDISGNLPDVPVNDIVIAVNYNALFIATDTNVWYSLDEGGSWDVVGDNLPILIVSDIKIHRPTNTLYAGTFGRSMYSFDLSQIGLSIADVKYNKTIIKAYPNPVENSFNLKFEELPNSDIKLYLVDAKGAILDILYKGEVMEMPKQFDVSYLPEGIYFIKLYTSGYKTSLKLIKN